MNRDRERPLVAAALEVWVRAAAVLGCLTSVSTEAELPRHGGSRRPGLLLRAATDREQQSVCRLGRRQSSSLGRCQGAPAPRQGERARRARMAETSQDPIANSLFGMWP
jgi:hypothetical protein